MSAARTPGPATVTDAGTRAGALAAAMPSVTLGRRLASFRAVRATAVPDGADVPERREDDLARRMAAAVGGTLADAPGGRVVRVDAGTLPVRLDRERLGRLPGQPPPDRRLVCLDTETTGLGTAAGTVAWVVGVGAWEADAFRVVQLLLPDHSDEGALLTALAQEIGDAPVLVTYNGRAFDWPLLVARYRLHGRPAPALGGHLDLLPVVRRLFRHRLGGARLRLVEQALLGVSRHDDVEGWEIPALYLDYLRGGPAAPLARVARHNAEDVKSLGRLLALLDGSLAEPAARPGAHPGDLASLAEMLRLHGRHDEALACLEHAVARLRGPAPTAEASPAVAVAEPGATRVTAVPSRSLAATGGAPRRAADLPWWSPRARSDVGGRTSPGGGSRAGGDAQIDLATVLTARARTLRRLGRHEEAAAAWEELATIAGAAGAAAWVEVAKIREHAMRDSAGALVATDRAAVLLARRRATGRPDPAAEAHLGRRRARLARRAARSRLGAA